MQFSALLYVSCREALLSVYRQTMPHAVSDASDSVASGPIKMAGRANNMMVGMEGFQTSHVISDVSCLMCFRRMEILMVLLRPLLFGHG